MKTNLLFKVGLILILVSLFTLAFHLMDRTIQANRQDPGAYLAE